MNPKDSDKDLIIQLLMDLRDAEGEREMLSRAADRAQHHLEAEQRKTARLRAQLEQQERLYLTEHFARLGGGDPYVGVSREEGAPRLPEGWKLTYTRERKECTQEVVHLTVLGSPGSDSLAYSRIVIEDRASNPTTDAYYKMHQQDLVLKQALDSDYAKQLQDRRLCDRYGF